MEAIEKIKEIAAQAVPAAKIEIINSTPAAQQPALLVDREHIYAVGKFFKEDPRFQMDFCSCVTAVDYPAQGRQARLHRGRLSFVLRRAEAGSHCAEGTRAA